MSEELVSNSHWLQLVDNSLINLARAESVFIQESPVADGIYMVTISFKGNRTPVKACNGSREKCKEYMFLLRDYVDAKKIVVYDSHKCKCSCGCMNQVIDGLVVCDDCAAGDHVGSN